MKLWGIEYTVKIGEKWLAEWTGPCGIYVMSFKFTPELNDILRGRSFLFRTRKQARDECKKLSHHWVKYRPVRLAVNIC